jgi:DNA transposition AAA+ family ATPase
MKEELRKEIVDAATLYIKEKGISLNEHARRSDINQAYLSQMINLKGEIADKWYYALAKSVGYSLDIIYWEHVHTPQYKAIIAHLEESRTLSRNRILIGDTGCGKTYAIKRYVMTNPQDTYLITISTLHTLHTLIEDIMNSIGLEPCGIPVTRLRNIAHRLSMFQLEGRKPLIIIDECENMKNSAFGVIKSLYDQLEGVCPIVLIGTSQIESKIENMLKLNKVGLPQFYRRFKAGMRYLPPVDKTFRIFLDTKVEDNRLKAYLRRICNNYGELHDYLELALKEADRLGQDLTYGFFMDLHGIKDMN